MLCDGVAGAVRVSRAEGLSGFATDVACEACPLAASPFMHSTLELGHLCLLAVLWEVNFCPQALHCHS